MYRLKFDGNRELYPSPDPEKMKATMEAFSPGSYEGYVKIPEKRDDQIQKADSMPGSTLRVPKDYLTRGSCLPFPSGCTYKPVNVLKRYFKHPDVCTAFTFQAKYIGMSPWKARNIQHHLILEHGAGIYHVKGGLNKLSEGMAKAFRESGGAIQLSSPVRRFYRKPDRNGSRAGERH